jgi:hypothetical protein
MSELQCSLIREMSELQCSLTPEDQFFVYA